MILVYGPALRSPLHEMRPPRTGPAAGSVPPFAPRSVRSPGADGDKTAEEARPARAYSIVQHGTNVRDVRPTGDHHTGRAVRRVPAQYGFHQGVYFPGLLLPLSPGADSPVRGLILSVRGLIQLHCISQDIAI